MKKTRLHKDDSLHRIKIIQGHLRAIEKMLLSDKYCVDIIHQSFAVQKALKRLDMSIMKEHLEGCVEQQMKNGQKDKSIAELLKIYELK